MQLTPNTPLQNGKYRIIRVLGQGGFGITYLAENVLLAKKIAIKEFFPKDFCGRDNTSNLTLGTQNNAETVTKLKARFTKEAQNIAKLDHPGIVKIHDVFEENNTAYYVMDYIDGENLNEMVKRNGPLSEAKAVEYIRKVGDALDYIHSRNMTHFDVKPANIVVRKADDYPILLDFGLSKQYDMQGGATSTLMQGVSNGYSPIELYNPGSLATFSPQTDVYSLGATLYYLITGKTPPSASELCSGMETLYLDSSHSPSIKEAITKAMATNRTHRPSSIYQLVNSIELPSSVTSSAKKTPSHVNDEETIFVSPEPHPKNESKSPTPPHISSSPDSTHSSISGGWLKGILVAICIIIICVCYNLSNKYYESYNYQNNYIDNPTSDKNSSSFSYPDGTKKAIGIYSGEYKKDSAGKKLPHGLGEIIYYQNDPDKRVKFIGEFRHGIRNNGTLFYQGGDKYIGTFSNDELWSGTIHYANGTTAVMELGRLK